MTSFPNPELTVLLIRDGGSLPKADLCPQEAEKNPCPLHCMAPKRPQTGQLPGALPSGPLDLTGHRPRHPSQKSRNPPRPSQAIPAKTDPRFESERCICANEWCSRWARSCKAIGPLHGPRHSAETEQACGGNSSTWQRGPGDS